MPRFRLVTSPGRPLRGLLAVQLLGLIAICVTRHEPILWFHPFGPLTKNVPLILATALLLWRPPNQGRQSFLLQ